MRAFLASLLVAAALVSPAVAGGGPAETVVLVNSQSPDSRRVADHFAKCRDIPAQQICEVKCTTALASSMDEFVRDVVEPLRTFLRARGLEDRCRFIVLTQGMPILAQTPTGPVSTAAALSLLDTSICGQGQLGQPKWKHEYTAGAIGAPAVRVEGNLFLVTALLSTTADEAIAMIDRSVASDGTAPGGARFVFQDANGAANVRDKYYDGARKELEGLGFATEHDGVGGDKVRDRKRVMGYMSGGEYSNLTVPGITSNEYLPGAICDMLQSYGAVPPNFGPGPKFTQFPITHMVRAGITGVHGTVAEPYNIAFPDWELFRPYVAGFTLAETFHQRMPYVYWMNLTLGDPLCAPYAKRPKPTLATESRADGGFTFKVAADGAARIDVYVDAQLAGTVTGAGGAVSMDARPWTDDAPHSVLVEASGPLPAEARGWITSSVKRHGPAPVAAVGAAPRIACEKVVVDGPVSVLAGESLVLRASGAKADGSPLAGWTGRLELRSVNPPVRWCRADANGGAADLAAMFTKAGDYELRVVAPDDGRETAVKVRVEAGPMHHATSPVNAFPLAQEGDLDVVVEDEFGNRVRDWEGTISLELPNDPGATLPRPAVFTKTSNGRGVLRGVLFTHPGRNSLVFRDDTGRMVSFQTEGLSANTAALRPWVVVAPVPESAVATGDPASSASGVGSVIADALTRRAREEGDIIHLGTGGSEGHDAAVAATWIESIGTTKARLLAASGAPLRILLDGKKVFDGTSKGSDSKGKREPVADIVLTEGEHRLTVVADCVGPTAMSVEIDDGKGAFPTTLRIRAHSEHAPVAFVVSGRVHGGPGDTPIGGAKIVVKGGDGRERSTTSGRDGVWWIAGLPRGDTTITVSRGTDPYVDPVRTLTLTDANATDVDFSPAGLPQRGGK